MCVIADSSGDVLESAASMSLKIFSSAECAFHAEKIRNRLQRHLHSESPAVVLTEVGEQGAPGFCFTSFCISLNP